MFPTFNFIEGQKAENSVDGQMHIMTGRVYGIPIADFVDAQTVLTRAMTVLPALYAPHPDVVNFPYATLRSYGTQSIRVHNAVDFDMVYKAPGTSDFILEEISQSEYLQTFTTALGTDNLNVWYRGGGGLTDVFSPPAGSQNLAISVQKFFGKRILRATGWMTNTAWQDKKAQVKAAKLSINSTQWGDDPDQDARGCWLFSEYTTRTRDLNHTKEIELYFIGDPRGHYPIGVWNDINGNHPAGCITEGALRAVGPPPVNGQINGKGLSMFSIYPESDFYSLFSFDPSEA